MGHASSISCKRSHSACPYRAQRAHPVSSGNRWFTQNFSPLKSLDDPFAVLD